jgi:hypothetical protein
MKAKFINEAQKVKNFIFKKVRPSGKWSSFEAQNNYDIKYDGKIVGDISEQRSIGTTKLNDGKFTVGFMIIKKDIMEDGNPNCVWRWARMKPKFDTPEDAQKWILENQERILSSYKLKII